MKYEAELREEVRDNLHRNQIENILLEKSKQLSKVLLEGLELSDTGKQWIDERINIELLSAYHQIEELLEYERRDKEKNDE